MYDLAQARPDADPLHPCRIVVFLVGTREQPQSVLAGPHAADDRDVSRVVLIMRFSISWR